MKAEVSDQVAVHVAELGAVRRRIVRWALDRATAPCARIDIEESAAGLAITCDAQKSAVAPADGRPVSFTGDDGRSLTLAHSVDEAGAVTQTFTGRHGTRTNRFVPRGDGLSVEVTIESPQLEAPLRYGLAYERGTD